MSVLDLVVDVDVVVLLLLDDVAVVVAVDVVAVFRRPLAKRGGEVLLGRGDAVFGRRL